MEIAEHIGILEEDGGRLAFAVERAGFDAPIPGLDWLMRDLVIHTGGVHRWAADIVATASSTTDTEANAAVGTGPGDDALLRWFVEGYETLVATLRAAPPDLECVTFLPAPSPLAFWARRQAHETAIHRADAERAAGEVTPFDVLFAQDGIGEILRGFAARRSNAIAREAMVSLNSTDGPSWLVTLGGERIIAEEGGDTDSDLTVSGTSSDIYLWLWNRPSSVTLHGDQSLADEWAKTVRVRWT